VYIAFKELFLLPTLGIWLVVILTYMLFLFFFNHCTQNVLCLILTIAVNIRKKQIIHLFVYILMISHLKMGVEQFLKCRVM